MSQSKTTLGIAALTVATLMTSTAMAGSFALKERSTRAQGLSFAGVTAGSGGLSSMGFNPAAIGLVENLELSGGLSFVQPIAQGTIVGGAQNGQTVDADRGAVLSNGYVGYRLEPDILIGLATYVPFGLTTQYEPGSVVAGDAVTSKLLTLVIAPTVGFEPMPGLTLALSGNIVYADARLTSSALNLDGNELSYSFGAGALWELSSNTTLGLAYQHGYNLGLEGSAQGGATGGAIVPVRATAQLPSTISFGVTQGLTDSFRLMGEVQWMNWSVFDKIDVTINNAVGQSDPQNYDDAFFFALGAEYDVSSSLTVRGGAAWDQTPTNSDTIPGTPTALGITNRTARIPDEDRIWLSIGASYDMSEHMSIDAGYSYLFAIKDPRVGLRTSPGTSVVYDGGAHIFSLGGSVKF